MSTASTTSTPSTRPILPASVFSFLILLLAFLLRTLLINRHGFWNNELITFKTILLSYPDLIRERLAMNHLPLYFIMEKAWGSLFGTSEPSMRAISVFFGFLAVWATGRLAARIGGPRLALPVLLSAAIHQSWINSSTEARMYSILIWASAESMDSFLAWLLSSLSPSRSPTPAPTLPPVRARARARNRARALANSPFFRWTAVTIFGLYIHMLFLPIFLLQIAAVLLLQKNLRPRLREFFIAPSIILLSFIPIAIAWATKQTKFKPHVKYHLNRPGPLLRKTIHLCWGDIGLVSFTPAKIAAFLLFFLALAGLVLYLRTLEKQNPIRRILLLFSFGYLAYIFFMYLASGRTREPVLGEIRYFYAFAPLVLILAWTGLLHIAATLSAYSASLRARARNRARAQFSSEPPSINPAIHRGDQRPAEKLKTVLTVFPTLAPATLSLLVFALQSAYTIADYSGVGEGLREAITEIEKNCPPGHGLVAVTVGATRHTLGIYYGKNLPTDRLTIDRLVKYEETFEPALDAYTTTHPDFWFFSYHDKDTPIWRYLKNHPEKFTPLTKRRIYGDSSIQLFHRN